MRRASILVAGYVCLAVAPWPAFTAIAAARPAAKTVHFVEFYTSDACSNCLPADKAVAASAGRPGLVLLSFHVPYWNYLGWDDRLGLQAAVARQEAYAHHWRWSDIFTPQVIVNGRISGTGKSPADLDQLIASAQPIRRLSIRPGKNSLKVALPKLSGANGSTVWIAVFDPMRIVAVSRGENAGHRLDEVDVVRDIMPIAHVGKMPDTLSVASDVLERHRGIAVFLERGRGGPVIAAGALVLPSRRVP
ncbi:DUF1223 domain-containing protein [Acidiphilium sp. AL]|uniref:DUF1223 domain-containing protein n=1 Tax=Acidiphilium iwatense TaxID=768198 RepID=A0ABS9DT80_9PROT|nr:MULTISPECIES: DUF1223 domain-containing protein [Acidiphilium]MCF3945892.1 DUF1223 domain-containing protein [Acidiphilium iwatense]MCU4159227.1 DUF1223 domain-containing protein [Acidiphilium sp. AL]